MSRTTRHEGAQPLSEREQDLLRLLVEIYIRDGQPVGSRTLARRAEIDFSPATIRNVMADLEEMGLVCSPHTSAGRVPTPRGYRLFVDSLLRVLPPEEEELRRLEEEFDVGKDSRALVEIASGILSSITQLAGIVTVPGHERVALRQIEFIKLSERRVLAILVAGRNEIQNRIIDLDRDYSPSELQQASNYLTEQFAGRDLRAVRDRLVNEMARVRDHLDAVIKSAVELGEKAFSPSGNEEGFIVAGQTHLMDYAELSNVEKLRDLFEAFNRKRDILHLLDRCIFAQGVQIFIGQESGYKVLDECSVVSAPYSVEGEVVGVLGVIGPTRMAYDRVIPIVDVTARLLGAALNSRT